MKARFGMAPSPNSLATAVSQVDVAATSARHEPGSRLDHLERRTPGVRENGLGVWGGGEPQLPCDD
jgi:hypothetical protein